MRLFLVVLGEQASSQAGGSLHLRRCRSVQYSWPNTFFFPIGELIRCPPRLGRGKTMLMDMFYESATPESKQRVHFHSFMLDVHNRTLQVHTHVTLLLQNSPQYLPVSRKRIRSPLQLRPLRLELDCSSDVPVRSTPLLAFSRARFRKSLLNSKLPKGSILLRLSLPACFFPQGRNSKPPSQNARHIQT